MVRLDVLDDTDLPALAKAVYAALASYATADGRAWPSVASIARRAGCGTTTVKNELRRLENAGYVVRKRRRMHGNRRLTTMYYLGDPPPEDGSKSPRPAEPTNLRRFVAPPSMPHTPETDAAVAALATKYGSRRA